MKKILLIIICIILIVLIFISIYFITITLKETNKQEKIFNELLTHISNDENSDYEKNISDFEHEEKINNVEDKEENNEEKRIKELQQINNDLKGWIKIEGTSINYPVMQSINKPNYYLNRDFYKNYSSYGTPYISEKCDINTSDNIIIYSHNMKNKKMFGELEKYKQKKFYQQNKIIQFNKIDKNEKYKIFAVFKTVVYSDEEFKYYEYVNFNNKEEFEKFINKVKSIALYEINYNPHFGDKILTLSTCEYSKENGRLVVMASLIL